MSIAAINKNRRKYQRYSVKEGVYASIDLPSQKLGQILDISLGGLSFTYINDDATVAEISNPSVTLSGFENQIKDIPFQTIDDFEIKNAPSFISMEMRKQRIQFGELSDNQISNLYYFIDKTLQ